MIWIEFAVRLAAACAAAVAFYVAWFAYEDEERKLQNKVETWWLQFDDSRGKMVSGQAAFVVVVAQRANGILDRMFSERLLSSDSIAESLCLVVGSNCIALMLMVLPADRIGENFPVLGPLVLMTFVCAAAPLVSPRLRMLRRAFMWMFAAFYLPALFLTLRDWNLPREMILLAIVQSLLGISAGIALTLFQVAIARYAMQATIVARSEWPIVLGMVLAYIPIGILIPSVMLLQGADKIETPAGFLATLLISIFYMGLLATVLWGLVLSSRASLFCTSR